MSVGEGGRGKGEGGGIASRPTTTAAVDDAHVTSSAQNSASPLAAPPSPLRLPPSALDRPPSGGRLLPALAYLWYCTLYGPCFALSKALFRFRFAGKSHVPLEGPVLMVANHQSNLDPVLIGLAAPRQLKYFARVGLFFWPFSWWIRALGAVPIDRDNAISGMKTTLKLLKQGEAVVVFPEGSRTPDGKMHEFLPGFCMLARRGNATIVPVAIDGAFDALPRGSALPRLAAIRLEICPRVSPNEIATMTDGELTQLVFTRIHQALQRGLFDEARNGSA